MPPPCSLSSVPILPPPISCASSPASSPPATGHNQPGRPPKPSEVEGRRPRPLPRPLLVLDSSGGQIHPGLARFVSLVRGTRSLRCLCSCSSSRDLFFAVTEQSYCSFSSFNLSLIRPSLVWSGMVRFFCLGEDQSTRPVVAVRFAEIDFGGF